jgi:hypothetical protein
LRPRLESLERRDLLASYVFSTAEDTPLVATDANTAYPVLVTHPEHGTVTFKSATSADNTSGGFVYAPAANYFGADHFTYTTNPPPGGLGPSELNDVSITITPVNDAPVAHSDQFLAQQNTTLTIDSPGVLKNDTDIDSTSLTAILVSQATHGTVVLKDGGGFTYTPAADYTGPDSFTYKASDGQATSEAATAYLYVANNTVVARDDNYKVAQNTDLKIAAPGVLGNDSGISDRPLNATLEPNSGPQHGKVVVNIDGSFTYTPATDYVGPDSFVYRATDVSPLANPLPPSSATAKVNLYVYSTAPIVYANNDVYYGQQNSALPIAAPGVLKNDYVFSGDATNSSGSTPLNIPLTSVLVTGPGHGTLDFKADGSFVYTPNPDFSGSDTFTYRAVMPPPAGATTPPTPSSVSHDVATVTLNIKVISPPPTPSAHDDHYLDPQNIALSIAAPGVLGNDVKADDYPLIANLQQGPSHGTLTLNGNGSFNYQPASGFTGDDKFTYYVSETYVPPQLPGGPVPDPIIIKSEPATVSISVRTPIVANNDAYSTQQNVALNIAKPGVLTNDYFVVPVPTGFQPNTPPTNQPLFTAMLVSGPADAAGTVKLNGDGSFAFTPATGFVGTATFTYQDSFTLTTPDADGAPTQTLLSNVATVTIYVKPPMAAPHANTDYYNVLQDSTLAIAAPGVLKNDVRVSDYPLVPMLDHGPAHGTLTLNTDGSFNYQPTAGYIGPDSFTYFDTETYVPRTDGGAIADPISLHSNTAAVYIYVQAAHPPVYAFDDYYKTTQGATLTIAAPGVLANDTIFPPPLPLNPSSDPNTGAGSTSNDGPSPIPIPYPNVTLAVALKSNVSHGTLILNADGSFTYTPDPTFTGADTFTYQATATANGTNSTGTNSTGTAAGGIATADSGSTTDPNLPCVIGGPCPTPPDDTATVTIYVHAPEPPPGPVAVNDFFVTAENTELDIRAPGVLTNDYIHFVCPPNAICANPPTSSGITNNEPPRSPLTAVLVDGPSDGTITLNANGSFDYDPNPDFVGIDTFTYQAQQPPTTADGATLLSNVATVTIKVVPAIAHNDQYQVLQDTTLNVSKPGVLANDAGGAALHPLMATQLSGPLHGALTLNADGSFSYIPNAGYSGPDLFTYRAGDGTTPPADPTTGLSSASGDSNGTPTSALDVGIVRIYVTPALVGIQAHNDKFPATENTELDVPAPGVLANDYGPVNVPVVATLVTDVGHGTLTLNPDGSFAYTPADGYTGEDHFTYKAAPAAAASTVQGGTATVTIYVMTGGQTPNVIIGGNQNATDESGPQNVTDFATQCSIGDNGQPATFTVTTDNPNLFTSPPKVDETGQLSYTPAPNVSGDATITVVTHDDTGDTTQTFTIHIDKPHPLYNAANPYDVNNDQFVAPSDVIAVINYLNAHSDGSVNPAEGEDAGLPYLDVSRDNAIAPIDALMIINALNAGLGGAGGEAPSADSIDAGLLTLVAQDTAEATMGRKRTG